jgi:pimeloyl-ACP methyl ester carboxylesterase
MMKESEVKSRPALWRWSMRILRLVMILCLLPLVLLAGCQSKLIYMPRPYGGDTVAMWQHATGGKMIDYQTSQGKQRAFLQGNLKSPRNLWIVCGGNGTVALDWAEWLQTHAPKEDAWLLVDFPGYGDCMGDPSPGTIGENLKAAVPLAAKELGWPAAPDARRLRFFGHSLGGAACLMAATEFKIQRGVLIAPFTSTMDMTREVVGVPLGFLVWHRFDNEARLRELAARGPGKVIIFHGVTDEVIPVTMSRKMAAEEKGIVELREIEGGRHHTIAAEHGEKVMVGLGEVGRE